MLDALNWGFSGWRGLLLCLVAPFWSTKPSMNCHGCQGPIIRQALPLEFHRDKEVIIYWTKSDVRHLFYSTLLHSVLCHSMLLYLITRHSSLCCLIPFELMTYCSILFWSILFHSILFYSHALSSCLMQGVCWKLPKKLLCVCACAYVWHMQCTYMFCGVVFRNHHNW